MMPGAICPTLPVRGALIVLEGCDRVGKSSQVSMLIDAIKQAGHDVVNMRFPERTTPTGRLISEYLKNSADLNDKAIHLLFSANRWELREKITELLHNKTTIVVDRYAASGAAFSSAKGLNLDWCCTADAGLPLPDLTIYLRTPSPAALLASRPGFGDERYETAKFQTQVAAQFDRLYELDHGTPNPTWFSVDAALPLAESHSLIKKEAIRAITDVKSEVRVLWPHLAISP